MSFSKPLAALLGVLFCFAVLTACSSEPTGVPGASTDPAGSGIAPAVGDAGGSSPSDAAAPGAAPSAIPEQPAVGEAAAVADGPAGEPQSLQEALVSYTDTDRVAIELLREDCAENRRCLEDVALLASYIENDCPHDSTCPKTMAGILDPLDRVQKTGLVSLPESYPLASELRQILARATHDEARDEAGRPPPTLTSEPDDASVTTATPSS